MEKFRQFEDETVGVNPFTQQPYRASAPMMALGVVLLLLRLPFTLVFFLLLLLTNTLASVLAAIYAAPLARLLRITIERVLARLLLFSLGFHTLPSKTAHPQTIRVDPSPSSPPPTHRVKGGDIMILNAASYIDILCLAATYSPVFTTTSVHGGLERVSLLGALRAAVAPASRNKKGGGSSSGGAGGGASTLEVIRASQGLFSGPIAVFPEAAPTNNKALLQFGPVANEIAAAVSLLSRAGTSSSSSSSPTTHIIGLRYGEKKRAGGGAGTVGAFSPSFVAGSVVLHLLRLLMQPSNDLVVVRLPQGRDPQPTDFLRSSSTTSPSDPSSEGTAAWAAAARHALSEVLGVQKVRGDASSHAAFVEAFEAASRRGGGGA